jgi:hypothetical protein
LETRSSSYSNLDKFIPAKKTYKSHATVPLRIFAAFKVLLLYLDFYIY